MMFPGSELFRLKDEQGLPLDMMLDTIMEQMSVEWPGFIEAARKAGWWDFQTYDSMTYGLQDAGIDRKTVNAIQDRFKLYVLKYPHDRN